MTDRKNMYVAKVFSRHTGRPIKTGIWASSFEAATTKLQHEVGEVISIERRFSIPKDVYMEWEAN